MTVAFDAMLGQNLFVLSFALILVLAAPVGPKQLQQARLAMEKAHFEEVVVALRDADLSALTPADRADAEFLLGVGELALTHDSLSQKALLRLFTEFPDFALPPYTAPKVAAACERARHQVVVVLQPRVEAAAVLICGSGLSQRANVQVTFTSGTGEQVVPAVASPPCFSATTPHDATAFYALVSLDGEVRAKAGSRDKPIALSQVVSGPPWYKLWWPSTIAAVVVAGVVTAIVVGEVVAHQHDPGTVRFTVAQP